MKWLQKIKDKRKAKRIEYEIRAAERVLRENERMKKMNAEMCSGYCAVINGKCKGNECMHFSPARNKWVYSDIGTFHYLVEPSCKLWGKNV